MQDGRLLLDDRLIEVNGESVLDKTNSEASATLRLALEKESSIPGFINVIVARRKDVPITSRALEFTSREIRVSEGDIRRVGEGDVQREGDLREAIGSFHSDGIDKLLSIENKVLSCVPEDDPRETNEVYNYLSESNFQNFRNLLTISSKIYNLSNFPIN